MTKEEKKPNLFTYATKELSQDALICYMLQWADKENAERDPKSHQIGKNLLDGFFNKYDEIEKPDIYFVKIHRQYKNIDILCKVKANESDKDYKYWIIIEDKTDTSHHSDQLNTYHNIVKGEKADENNILRIYYKSGEEYNLDHLEGYKLFSKEDILKVLEVDTDNQILKDYKEHIESLERISSYKKLKVTEWQTNSWISFIRDLKESGLNLGKNITNGKGVNKGIYFNYKVIEKDKIGFYLRISFEKQQLQFKLENEGNKPSKELGDKYYNQINKNSGSLEIKKASYRDSIKTMTLAGINNFLKLDNNDKYIDFDKTKEFIESIIIYHNLSAEDIKQND